MLNSLQSEDLNIYEEQPLETVIKIDADQINALISINALNTALLGILVGCFLGYMFIKGLLTNWKR